MAIDPIPFPESNICLKPAPGNEDTVSDLDIYRDDDGRMVSKWKLSQDEIEEINRTGVIWLWVFAQRHPPVTLTTRDPFTPQG